MEKEHKVFNVLEELGIDYQLHSHPAVFTVDEAVEHWQDIRGAHPKNLFLRNDKGKRHYLVIIEHSKQVDLKRLQQEIGSSRLSFASERRLEKYLGLTPGSVSGFGLINDADRHVEVIIDRDLMTHDHISFHPNINTATLTITTSDFEKFLDYCGNKVRYVPV
ncbi:MAG: prolyl-tRNA synthetase associated domain-containing protein [Spirochaetota bacterium]